MGLPSNGGPFLGNLVDVLFPVGAIERLDGEVFHHKTVQTAAIDADPLRVRARIVVDFDSTAPAKQMLRHPTVESVTGLGILSTQQAHLCLGNDHVNVSAA